MDSDTQKQLMETLVKNSEKQLFYSRIAALAALIAAAALGICLAAVVPSVMQAVDRTNEVMTQASGAISLADEAIRSVTDMSNSIRDMGTKMDALISDNADSIEEVMKKVESIDFEGLNSAISDLGDTVEPFAKFFNRFK